MEITNVMTNNVSTLERNSTVREAAEIMHNLNVGAIPVCEGSKPIGIITDRDIAIRNTVSDGNAETPVEKIMTNNLVYGTPDMTAKDAAELMASNQIRRLPVVDNDNLVGIVSLGDLAVQSKSDMEAGKALTSISVPSKPND
ncbi:CBS domain-containing protein [Selenihalanaerobacter shriftii]|uniref:CBS domain-containing protein n=1 Tax=Selenihalanaerobacter shriftii TaxID=142842 RepID=A0A1T4QAD3_9FIRM|nr:CBS domain-containing protein [Selenihalanaerobacter shriftii]SKA00178.1 CBS domain-containing protein [Selenihalanaerobacter shriftii]